MPVRLEQLDARLRRVSRQLEQGVERYVAAIGAEIGRVLVPATPVDTGLARGNWRPSLNVPISRPTSLPDPTGAGAVARIASVAQQFRIGDSLHIVNNVPYISLLNAGSSPQAPAGFVQASVRNALRNVASRRTRLL